ncbi:hypothetical protein [Glycomyces paridis]|uniref:Uncharacterized protein n=1 Tax=Glycomyces paridis TaxID=2126555 RepID=A0A4S8PF46_9ACTN|nr:hypothetical protein [Glycomyces paridis]THV29053.1 hypothetical protein E9998_09925 [Glycomyces paridis]
MKTELTWALPIAAALPLMLSACGTDLAAQCEDAFAAAAGTVEGVVSAEWDCSEQFGGGWQRAEVVVEAATEEEAVAIMEDLLRAFAAEPDLLDRWSTPQEYANEDGTIVVGTGELGFPGVPDLGEVREHYGITPE